LGVEGERELIDLQLSAPLTRSLVEGVNDRAPAGLRISAFHQLAGRPASLVVSSHVARYQVRLPADLHKRARQEGRLSQFREAGSVPILKASKGRQRTIDLKRCVREVRWTADPDPESGEGLLVLELRLQEPSGQVASPWRALTEIFRWSPEERGRCLLRRICLLDAQNRPLDEASSLDASAILDQTGDPPATKT
jgi:hypothetical protein